MVFTWYILGSYKASSCPASSLPNETYNCQKLSKIAWNYYLKMMSRDIIEISDDLVFTVSVWFYWLWVLSETMNIKINLLLLFYTFEYIPISNKSSLTFIVISQRFHTNKKIVELLKMDWILWVIKTKGKLVNKYYSRLHGHNPV